MLLPYSGGRPSIRQLPIEWSAIAEVIGEWHKDFSRDKRRVLMRLQPSTLDLTNKNVRRKDLDFPEAWAKMYGKGRVFYSALGHATETWDNPQIQTMYFEAIKWTLGMSEADVTPRPLPQK